MNKREEIAERIGEVEIAVFVAELFADLEAKIDHRFNQIRRMLMTTNEQVDALNAGIDNIAGSVGDATAQLTQADNNILAELQRLNDEHADIDLSPTIDKVQGVADILNGLNQAVQNTKNLIPSPTDQGTTQGGTTNTGGQPQP